MKNNLIQFNNHNIELINKNNQLYLTGDQIGRVLEYADTAKISHLYNAHKSEFDEEMSCLIRRGRTRVRIFNREGAWLIGMFARTPKAAEFRKWVLKVLGMVADSQSVDKPVTVSEHTRALPAGKKEIVLSAKAREEIGGIVKAVVVKALEDHPSTVMKINGEGVMTLAPIMNNLHSLISGACRKAIDDSLKLDLENDNIYSLHKFVKYTCQQAIKEEIKKIKITL